MNINTSMWLDQILPPNAILIKHCHGAWTYYKNEDDFKDEKEYMNQKCDESFQSFLERVINQLMEDEKDDEERLVAIDHAIWGNKDYNWFHS